MKIIITSLLLVGTIIPLVAWLTQKLCDYIEELLKEDPDEQKLQ